MEIFLKKLLSEFDIEQSAVVSNTVLKLRDDNKIAELERNINSMKNEIMRIFASTKNTEEFKEKSISISNGHVNTAYTYTFDLPDFPDIVISGISNASELGLNFDKGTHKIYGTPTLAGSVDLELIFYNKNDNEKIEFVKKVPFVVNPDPKDLWNDIPSDKNLKYSKEDKESFSGYFLDKKIVIASRRGRSHAHEGQFRDDHYCVKELSDGWAIIAIADGAGSAKYARQGSRLATEKITEYLNDEEALSYLSDLVQKFYLNDNERNQEVSESDEKQISSGEDIKITVKSSIINVLYRSVRKLHTYLNEFAKQDEIALKDLNTTLIFALIKKIKTGYVVLTFGVGDCPINIIDKKCENVKLLNILDVGEFGGGTRFITMPDIFSSPHMSARFSINIFDDFSKIFLMTDGIYDPKFVTENKLEDLETWNLFMSDLGGENQDNAIVDFENDHNIGDHLLEWMNFWSKGNHDDRTLAIIY